MSDERQCVRVETAYGDPFMVRTGDGFAGPNECVTICDDDEDEFGNTLLTLDRAGVRRLHALLGSWLATGAFEQGGSE